MSSRRCKEENPGCLRNRGFSLGAPIEDLQVKRESSCHDRRRLSTAASRNQCRPLVPRFSANEFVTFLPVGRCSISALTAIVASVIAASVVARNPAADSAVKPTDAINKVPKGASIIATASAPTASVSAPA